MALSQKAISQLNDLANFLSFTPTWHLKKFIKMPQQIVALFYGNQCLGRESMIYDPVLMVERRVDEIDSNFHVLAWDGKKLVVSPAKKPFHKEVDDLYEFTLSDGQSFVASMGHRILTPSGYRPLSEVPVGCAVFRPLSNSVCGPSVLPSGAFRSFEKGVDYQHDCFSYFHQYDELLQNERDSALSAFPSQDGVQQHMEPLFLHEDAQGNKHQHIPCTRSVHPSNLDATGRYEDRAAGTLSHASCKDDRHIFQESQEAVQPHGASSQDFQYNFGVHQRATPAKVCQVSSPCATSIKDSLLVTSVSFKRRDVKWDFEVPRFHNYFHAGTIHHNTGKTGSICYQYVLRVLGKHPVPKKNVMYFECETRSQNNIAPHGYYAIREPDGTVIPSYEKGTWNLTKLPADGKCPYCGGKIVIHQRHSKKIRLCSETLPGDKEATSKDGTTTAETKNTIYPEMRKWMPPFLIKRDITFRNPALICHDPNSGMELNGTKNKGDDIVFDFVSYSQSIQAGAGVQRMSVYCDEEPPKDFYDEQLPRLLAEDGDFLLGLTPANGLSWTFDDIFEKAQVYFRTEKVVNFLNENDKSRKVGVVEMTGSARSIAVLQAATDDNPTLGRPVIEQLFASVDDPDTMATRRFGIHRQVSGRIFKEFDYKTHYIDFAKYFPTGMFHEWNHYRMIDYHPHNKWAVVWLSMSPQNEAFVWNEWCPDPEKIVTRMIANEMALMSTDYRFKCDLIDPRAAETQTNTGTTTVDDLNDAFSELKREGICKGAYWETWDTKGTRGREVVRERLKNAKEVGLPFNNKRVIDGTTRYLPTLWIGNRCPQTAQSMKQWRLESWARASNNVNKDRKEAPAQKFSHLCTAIEAVFKDSRCRPPLIGQSPESNHPAPRYFQGRRKAA